MVGVGSILYFFVLFSRCFENSFGWVNVVVQRRAMERRRR